MCRAGHQKVTMECLYEFAVTVTQRQPSVYILPRGKLMCGVQGGMTLQALGGGEFALWLVPRHRAAPLYWGSSSHTHTPLSKLWWRSRPEKGSWHMDYSRQVVTPTTRSSQICRMISQREAITTLPLHSRHYCCWTSTPRSQQQ
jgi:hypothetical protein